MRRAARTFTALALSLTVQAAQAAEPPAPVSPAEPKADRTRYVGTVGVVSLPRLVSADLFARLKERWGVGVLVEWLPPGLIHFGSDTTLSWLQLGAQGRYFFTERLYAGLAFGYQYARADSRKFGSEVDYLTEAAYFAPRLGFLHTFKGGLTLGGELGVTLPFAATTSFASDGTEDSNARKAAKTFGMFVMPYITLFRIGYTL